uniref:Uncharacterized protein n=1 Tax=Physcomitrium patens TaxID=3218 RepID=A0A7I4AF21_PHYPA
MDVPVIIQLEMEEQFFRRTPPERRNGRDSKWFLPHDFLVLQSLRAPLVSSDKTMSEKTSELTSLEPGVG